MTTHVEIGQVSTAALTEGIRSTRSFSRQGQLILTELLFPLLMLCNVHILLIILRSVSFSLEGK